MAPANELRAGGGSCPEDEALAALLDGAVSPDERAAIEAHAVRCDACRAALADASRALAAIGADADDGIARPSASALARAAEAGAVAAAAPHASRGPAPARRPLPRWAAAAALLVLAGGVFALLRRDRPAPAPGPEEAQAKAQQTVPSDVLVVASVTGSLEVRSPGAGAEDWRPVAPGERIVAGTSLRSLDRDAATVVFEGDVSMSFRREVRATLKPGASSLAVEVDSGGLAVSPREGMSVTLDVPQGHVTSPGAPLEVLVNRRGTIVIARSGGNVACESKLGAVLLEADHHTILFDDRPPAAPRVFPFKRGDGQRPEGGRRGGRRGPCHPPGGPELDGLYKDGPT